MLPRLCGAILIGGRSERMGRPKQLLPWRGGTLLQHTAELIAAALGEAVVLVGEGEVPASCAGFERWPDAARAAGPLGGLLALFRRSPGCAWLVAACDLPLLSAEALAWLIAQRRPGFAAVLPQAVAGGVEPLPAIYEPAAGPLLEELAGRRGAGPRQLARLPSVRCVPIPPALRPAWRGVNTPQELAAIVGGDSGATPN